MSVNKYTRRSTEIPGDDDLAQLALDLRWSWHHGTDQLWKALDPELWEMTRNPLVILQTVSRKRLEEVTSDLLFKEMLAEMMYARRQSAKQPQWFTQTHPDSPLKTVAYFSMEYMLSEALPIYSGGLGNVAGDQLKAANDLGVPVVAIGLLYQQGYFRQHIDASGAQRALYPTNDPGQLPILPLREADGDWVRLTLHLPEGKLWIRTWVAQVGRTKLYLLDTNDPANPPGYRGITSELYGGGPDLRILQEQVLGIGGWRLLAKLGIRPEVCHLNEGHAAFAVLDRAASYMEETGLSFWAALTATRAGNVFTTHTPVEAGFDRFSEDLMRTHFTYYAEHRLKVTFDEIMGLGRQNASDRSEPFNMAYLATRGSGAVNGVSRLHGEVSRRIFQSLYPRWPTGEVPIHHVTNGVHTPTWDSEVADRLWHTTLGQGFWHGGLDEVDREMRKVDDPELWQLRNDARRILIEYVRKRYARQVAGQGGSERDIEAAGQIFDPGTLTLGFARRFATYKRPNLLLHDPDRLTRILSNPQRPVQLMVAGKAHPQDLAGQAMIRQWNEFTRRPGMAAHVAFLADYDMLLTEQLVGGVDVWVNTPRRPWEASGTSGMKVLVNGGLNLSELDGWWVEAYTPEVGWAIGDGKEHGEDPAWDAAEANALYLLLENEIVPGFYTRDGNGIPVGWIAKVRESMARLTPQFSANRTVREYTENHYLPAAAAYVARTANGGKLGVEIEAWREKIASHWPGVWFGAVHAEPQGAELRVEVGVSFDGIDPEAIRVELFADGNPPVVLPMERGPLTGLTYLYSVRVPGDQKLENYTPRVIPFHPAASVPLEANQILWES